MQKASKIFEKVTLIFAIISVAAIVFMMFFISADVFKRWFFSGGIPGSYELVEVAMAVSAFSAFSYAQTKHSHVHVTLLIQYFPQKLRFLSYALMSLITTAVMFVISFAAFRQCNAALVQNMQTNTLHVPMYFFYGYECIAMFVFGATLVFDTIRYFMAMFSKKIAAEIQADWT